MPDFCENSLLLIILSKSAITMSMKRTICINVLISAAHNLHTPHNHSGYRRYLYYQGNEKTTGGTVEAAAKP